MRVEIREDILKQDLKGEAVLLDMKTGTYYRLNDTAARAWPILVQSGKIEDALKELGKTYSNVPEKTLRDDLEKFVQMLLNHELATQADDSTSS